MATEQYLVFCNLGVIIFHMFSLAIQACLTGYTKFANVLFTSLYTHSLSQSLILTVPCLVSVCHCVSCFMITVGFFTSHYL